MFSNSFLNKLQNTLAASPSNLTRTENGAVGYRSTGKKLLDLNFAVSSLRSRPDWEIERMFQDACSENVDTAIVWLFFCRDVRGGLGERRVFRIGLKYLAREFAPKVRKLLPLIAEYGRWDDLLPLMDSKVRTDVICLIRNQLVSDMAALKNGSSVSLLAKWLPSENSSSQKTRIMAAGIRTALNVTPRTYRIMLSRLRKKINIVETRMSMNQWSTVDYQAVPSRANLIYNKAFLRHDEQRRREYLGKLEKGEAKINASTLFPHDILHRYASGFFRHEDPAIEAMWKALPDTVKGDGSTIVVADGSGSMCSYVGGTNVRALTVANALAIYFSERLSGPYQDRYITFSSRPQLVNLSGATTLYGKNRIACSHCEVANTNIEAVFDLLLKTAVDHRLEQSEIPANVLIISDMEFDACAVGNHERLGPTLFGQIAKKWAQVGYKLPRLIFWNVNSRTGAIPVTQNAMGVALVSGFSPNVCKMVMSNQTDPMAALLETLASERYRPVVEALSA